MAPLFGPNENVTAVFASAQAVIGPGEVVPFYVGGDACYQLVGRYGGRVVEVVVRTDANVLTSIELAAALDGLPITLLLNHRKNTSIYAVPEVRTGDADFDGVFLLNGFPSEVLREALDAPTRGWLLERFRNVNPTLETENGRLTISVVLRATKGLFMLPYGREIPPAEIAVWFDALLAIANRLIASFHRQRDGIARTRGTLAAEQWVRHHVDAMEGRTNRRRNLRILLFGVFLGLPVLGALAVVAAMLASMLLR